MLVACFTVLPWRSCLLDWREWKDAVLRGKKNDPQDSLIQARGRQCTGKGDIETMSTRHRCRAFWLTAAGNLKKRFEKIENWSSDALLRILLIVGQFWSSVQRSERREDVLRYVANKQTKQLLWDSEAAKSILVSFILIFCHVFAFALMIKFSYNLQNGIRGYVMYIDTELLVSLF